MAKQNLSLGGLRTIDGGLVNAAINDKVRAAVADCKDRPGEAKPRKVVLTLEICPVADQRGKFDRLSTACVVSSKFPDMRSIDYDMRVTAEGDAEFEELSPEDAGQGSLPLPHDKGKA